MKKIFVMICLLFSTPVYAGVEVYVNKARQTMDVFLNKERIYSWRVSTGRFGHTTPSGWFSPYSLQKMHFSKKYNHAPMPYSIFFKGGYAVHGTNDVGHLGKPVSHGCVRLNTLNAKILFNLVKENSTKIFIDSKAR